MLQDDAGAPETLLLQFQARDERIEVDRLAGALKGVVPVEQEVPPCRRRNFGDECQRLAVAGRLVLGHQPRQDCRVVKNDRVGDQPCALVADRKVRYKGLAKNTAQLFRLFGLANLVIAQNRFRSVHGSSPSRV